MTNQLRIYLVSGPTEEVLVRATSQAQAIRHVVGNLYTAEIPTRDRLVMMMQDGASVVGIPPQCEAAPQPQPNDR